MKKTIFVIMPFVKTPSRNEDSLTAFFNVNLKKRIESEDFGETTFIVKRSDDSFDIGKQIILDIYNADYIICDLSGEMANPNVMYELGLRFSLSNKPVILIRESNPNNKKIFDIVGFHTKEYDPLKYFEIEDYIINKLHKFELKEEIYKSPVLEIIGKEPAILKELLVIETANRLSMAQVAINSWRRILAAFVTAFAFQDETIKFSQNIENFHKELVEQQDKLVKLDWSKFNFKLNTSPSFDALLIQPPTIELYPPLELSLFKTLLNEFYHFFFASGNTWDVMTFDKVFIFNTETLIIWILIDRLKAYIEPVDNDKELLLKEFNQTISKSIVLSEFLQNTPHNNGSCCTTPKSD